MGLSLNSTWISRGTGNPTSTSGLGICFWIKRTADFTGRRYLGTIRNAGETVGHQLWVNDPVYPPDYSTNVQWNYGNSGNSAPSGETFELNEWKFIALSGAGTACDYLVWDNDTNTFAGDLTTQAPFSIASIRFGSDGYGTAGVPCVIAHLRIWSSSLSLAEYEAEKNSATTVKTAGIVSAHSFAGGSLAAALQGEIGAAWDNSGTTYVADMPTLSGGGGGGGGTTNYPLVTGTANLPTVTTGPISPSGAMRYNRVLYSDDFTNAVWVKPSLTVTISAAPTSLVGRTTPQRVKWNASGGLSQVFTSAPSGMHIFSIAVKKVDCDFFCLRFINSTFSGGAQGHFNLNTGVWDYTAAFGSGVTQTGTNVRQLENGWFLISMNGIVDGIPAVEMYPMAALGNQTPAVGKSIDLCAVQFEAGIFTTYYKPTQSVVASRTFSNISVTMPASVGVSAYVTATATLLDEFGGPWDFASPVTFTSNYTPVAEIAQHVNLYTNGAGQAGVSITGKSNGAAGIIASHSGLTSVVFTLTVGGSSVTRYVEIVVEPGWEGTFGWWVGVYRRHPTERFPDTRLFIVGNQAFQTLLVNGKSRMALSVPSNVVVSQGEIVEVVMENDNWQGKAVDGPGIFPATVI